MLHLSPRQSTWVVVHTRTDCNLPPGSIIMDLREYEQNKFAIAHILRSALTSVPEPTTDLHERLQPIFARLAEDRFNLVVVGRFNRGKTSLMNAILGTDRLPTGIIPLTSVITSVGYGSTECVVLRYHNSMLEKEITIDELPQHVTQLGNPGNVQRVATAEIRLPSEILRRGFYFVDTPGLGSAIVENTLTTEAFLPEADAFVLVTSYDSPLSEEELSFFKMASSSGRRVFVVVNKHDTVSPDQRQTVLSFVRQQLNDCHDSSAPPVFSVSSTDGLEAKLSRDEKRLRTSGLPAFESELVGFLLREKSKEFLQRMCDRAGEFLRELPRSKEIAAFMLQVDVLAKQLETNDRTNLVTPLPATTNEFADLHQLKTCEICAKIGERLWDFLCKYQYEISADSIEQQRLADRGGLCPFHTWQLQSVASPYGMCAGYPALFDRLATRLRDLASTTPPAELCSQIQRLIPSEAECTLCIARNKAENEAIETAARLLEGADDDAMKRLSAICLPHFAALVSALHDDRVIRTLLQRHAAVLQRFSEDMSRYVIKYDGRRRYLASKEEASVAERGLLLIAGRRQVNFVPRPVPTAPAKDANSTHQRNN